MRAPRRKKVYVVSIVVKEATIAGNPYYRLAKGVYLRYKNEILLD
jgi:hypothetical protein